MVEEKEEVVEEAPLYIQRDADLTRWQLSPDDIISELEHSLRGEFWNPIEGKWIQKGVRLLNDKGINHIITDVQSRLHKSVVLSNLTDDDVRRICMEVRHNLIDVLFLKYKEFEIDKANLSTIVNLVDHIVFVTMKRAFEEGERRFLGVSVRRVERVGYGEEKKSKFSWIPFFGGKGED